MLKRILINALAFGISCAMVLPVRAQVAPSSEQVQRYSGLLAAVQSGDSAQIKMLLAKKALLDVRDAQQRTPLHLATYARQREAIRLLAAAGADLNAFEYVTLAFDASHQGASGGMPRFLDDPMRRVADVYSAIDYLTTLGYVDANRIGALGICAGGGIAIKASMLDRRIKTVATVSGIDVGAATRRGWDGKAPASNLLAMLESVAKERSAEAAGAEPVYVPYVPNVGDKTAPRDLQEAADYYLTPRGQHPNTPNKMLLISLGNLAAFSGFDGAETLLTQPLLVVAGNQAGSLWQSQELYAKAAGPKELSIIDGATHMDLYDGKGANTATNKLVPFFARTL